MKDELFDAFAVDNYIEKYYQCKQTVTIALYNTIENNTKYIGKKYN